MADDERYNTTAALYICVDCGGSGKNAYDGSLCNSCYGNGTTYVSVADQLNSNPRSQSGTLCGGSGVCPKCKGHNGHRYGDLRYCSTCGNTGSYHWCHGQGKYFSNGTVYEGVLKHGKKDGKGKKTWADGAVYEGEWKDNNRHGKGKMI